VLIATHMREVLEFLGRDPTLSYRTYIWKAALYKGPANDLFGTGFRAFWQWPYASDVMFNTNGSMGTRIGNGHNGYLDTWLELGWVGLGLVFALFCQAFYRSCKSTVLNADRAMAFFPTLLVFTLVYSMTELVILVHSELTWTLLTTGLIALDWKLYTGGMNRQTTTAASPGPL